MIDNTPKKLRRNYGNLVWVRDFEGDPSDTELVDLMPYLDSLVDIENLRTVEKRGWRNQIEQ